jgi:aminoglycoside 3-N-acetyltransferase
MSEEDVIKRTQDGPVTVSSLIADLSTLGVKPGMTLLVHSSLSALGWVCGGPVAVVLALEKILGPEGTLVMPAHSGDLSDPAEWENPPVPEDWWEPIRQTMPAYDPDLTPTRSVGIIPECFRKQKGVLRSLHPHFSFAARGAHAASIIEEHTLDFGLGEESPLARLFDLDSWILLLGVGHPNNTSLHLAEYRAAYPAKQLITCSAPVMVEDRRIWTGFQDIELSETDFEHIGEQFANETGMTYHSRVGCAAATLIPQRPLVDYAVHWMERNRRQES